MIEKGHLFHIFICHFLIIGSKDPSLSSKEMASSKVKTKKSNKKKVVVVVVVVVIVCFVI